MLSCLYGRGLPLTSTLFLPLLLQAAELLDLPLGTVVFFLDLVFRICQLLRHVLAALSSLLDLGLDPLNVLCQRRLLGEHVEIAIFVVLQLCIGLGRPQCEGEW